MTRLERIRNRGIWKEIEELSMMGIVKDPAVDTTFLDADTARRHLRRVSMLTLGGPAHGRLVQMDGPTRLLINPAVHDGIEIELEMDGTTYRVARTENMLALFACRADPDSQFLDLEWDMFNLLDQKHCRLSFHSAKELRAPDLTLKYVRGMSVRLRTEIAATGICFTLSDRLELDVPDPMERVILASDHPEWRPLFGSR